MADKLKFYLGYDEDKNIKAIDARSLLIAGAKGSGKTIFLNNFIYNLLLHNSRDILQVKYYTNKYVGTDMMFMSKNKEVPLLEFVNSEEKSNVLDFIQEAAWLVEDREHALRMAECESIHEFNDLDSDVSYKEFVYIVDGFKDKIEFDSQLYNKMKYVITRGSRCGVHLVIVDTNAEMLPDTLCSKFQGKVALGISAEGSIKLLESTVAATSQIYLNHIAIYKDNVVYHSPQYLRTPLLTKEKMQVALNVFNHL